MKIHNIYISILFLSVASIIILFQTLNRTPKIKYTYYIDGNIASTLPIKGTHVFENYYCKKGRVIGYFDNNNYVFVPNTERRDLCSLYFNTATKFVETEPVIENVTPIDIPKSEPEAQKIFKEYNAYTKEKTKLYSLEDSEKVVLTISKYEVVTIIGREGNKMLIKYKNDKKFYKGYIDKGTTKKLPNKYIEVDISRQKMFIYSDGEKIFSTNVVTGKPSTPTPLGYFKINGKAAKVYLKGPTWYCYVDYFIPFIRKEYGFHDSSWQSKYGGDWYLTHGSHGCVNVAPKIMPKLYELVSVGDRVIIHG